MSITINIYYKGENGNARKFANEMIATGIVDSIRKKNGNERYDYFYPINDPETVLLIDSWKDRRALDIHHSLPLMEQIISLRKKYDLHMKVERYIDDDSPDLKNDEKYIRK